MEMYCDCSYSGQWLKQCMEYLDECKVHPCGHSAREKKTMLKLRASCRSDQVPHTLLYSARGCGSDKNKGTLYIYGNGYEITEGQNTHYIDDTVITCKAANFEAPCLLPVDYTWQKKKATERLFFISGTTSWGYFLVIDDEDTLDKVCNGKLSAQDVGEMIEYGIGKEPPTEVKRKMDRLYPGNRILYLK